MSYLWYFYSFSTEKFSRIFGTATAEQEEKLIETVRWEGSSFKNSQLAESLALKILKEGISYEELSETEAETLDTIISLVFSPEGLSQELEVEPESPDGLHPSIVQEMMERVSGIIKLQLLPILAKGQRLGQVKGTTDCGYLILKPEAIDNLSAKVKIILETEGKWSDDYFPQLIDKCLLSVVHRIGNKQKGMVGFLG